MSHLAHHRHQPDQAIQLALYGLHGLQALAAGPQPQLSARLLAMQARGFAALSQANECRQLLVRAEKAINCTHTEAASPWVSPFDQGSLASETARCMCQLGDFSEAQRQAESVIELRPGDRTRSRAFGQLIVVTALIAQGEPDHACAVAQEVLNATTSLGSYQVIQQLFDLKQQLEPYRVNNTVSDFLTCLEVALHDRLGLYQWLAKDAHGHVVELQE